MHLNIFCTECTSNERALIHALPVEDSGIYQFECDCGFRSAVWLSNPKFEILFESGALALIDGYTREAVSSIHVAQERFQEFFIEMICLKHDIPKDGFQNSWKHLSRQSERQFGAFMFAYLFDRRKEAPVLSRKSIEFRNDVIHKGIFPTFERTYYYAEEVANLIADIYRSLLTEEKEVLDKNLQTKGKEHFYREAKGKPLQHMNTSTMLNQMCLGPGSTFKKQYDNMKGSDQKTRTLSALQEKHNKRVERTS